MSAERTDWPALVVAAAQSAYSGHEDARRAAGAFAYMKEVAPFLGIDTPTRRRLLKAAWRDLPSPTSGELGRAALALMRRREREYHYAAYDLITWYRKVAAVEFLPEFGAQLLLTQPWWDTVDGLVTAAVSPLCREYGHVHLIDEWSESGDRWLIRAAIGHQRGWKSATDTARVLQLCDRHWAEKEFFIAKAIGWALRDLASLDGTAVVRFLRDHEQTRNTVATREALKGLRRGGFDV